MRIVRQVKALIVKCLCRETEQEIVGYLKSGSFSSRRLADIVNGIHGNEDEFPEWHRSVIVQRFVYEEPAKLFAPPVLINEKKSKGYWF